MTTGTRSYTLLTPPDLHPEMELVMRVMPMPEDTNGNGDIFGGWIMARIDLGACVLPARVAKGRVATVAVNEFVFRSAMSVGDVLSIYARIERIGNTSITVAVEAWAERNPSEPFLVKVTEAQITYVAIDAEGRPRPIPKNDA